MKKTIKPIKDDEGPVEEDKNPLTIMFEGLQEMREKRRQAEIDFSNSLREPDTQTTDEDGTVFGFWRVPHGIICLRKSAQGHWMSMEYRIDYDEDLLVILTGLYRKPSIAMNVK